MKTGITWAILLFTAALPSWSHAQKKGKANGGAAKVAPSTQLDPIIGPCVEAIVAPLEEDPKAPTGQVAKLRSSFAISLGEAKTTSQKQFYVNAIAVCDSITKALDDRAKMKAGAEASARMPPGTSGGSITKSMPQPGRKAGYLAQQIRKKQEEEREFAEAEAKKKADFLHSGAYTAWAERAPKYRQSVMAYYTRQSQFEAMQEKNDAPVAKLAPVVASAPAKEEKAAATNKSEMSAKMRSFVGEWEGPAGKKTIIIKEDHTAINADVGGENVNGTWTMNSDGEFDIKWEKGTRFVGKISADGQTMSSNKNERGGVWTRKKP